MATKIVPPRGMLVDELFAATYHPEQRVDNPHGDAGGSRRMASQMRAALISSQRYFLDDEVVRAAIELGVQHPDILVAMLLRARLPFPKMFIEWDQRVALEAQNLEVAEDAPPIIGAFVEQISHPNEIPVFRITEMGMAYNTDPPRATAHATSIIYCLDQPILERMPQLHQERSSLSRFTGISKEVIDRCLLGSTYSTKLEKFNDDEDDDDDEDAPDAIQVANAVAKRMPAIEHRLDLCRKLAEHATHTLSPFWPSYETMLSAPSRSLQGYERLVQHSLLEFSGTWRFIVSILALIQAREFTDHVQPPRNPAKRRFVGNKVVPYLQHWRVSLKMPRKVILRKFISSTRESLPQPRRSIEGYWRSRHANDASCEHVDVSETPNRYRCALCKRALYFTPSHERGSAEVGYIRKDRVVERRNRNPH